MPLRFDDIAQLPPRVAAQAMRQVMQIDAANHARNIAAPKESDQQELLIAFALIMSERGLRELELLQHTPNEGKRSKREGAKLKRMGMRPGFPDMALLVPRGGFHGFVFELKRDRTCKVSDKQRWWLERLAEQGYKTDVFYWWQDAARALLEYLSDEKPEVRNG